MVINSTSISVYWDPPPLDDQNGVIASYTVIINNINRTINRTINHSKINVTNQMLNLADLQEFEVYDIQVAAMTTIGVGPFSSPVRNQTFEGGKYMHTSH